MQRVVVVGASVSAADIAVDLVGTAKLPVHAVVKGHKANIYFGDVAFKHPAIKEQPSISRISSSDGRRTVHFADGSQAEDVDHIVSSQGPCYTDTHANRAGSKIFGTGYSWSLPFLPDVPVRNNRVTGLYQHVVYQKDATLLFVGAVRFPRL